MRAFAIGFFIVFLQFLGFSQTGGGFSNLYLYKGERSTTFSDVVASSDTLIAYGISYTSDSSPYTGVVLALFDTLGNPLGEYTQSPPPNELMLQWYDNDLVKLSNGHFACTGVLFSTQRAFLTMFDAEGQLILSKNYSINNIFTMFPQRLLEMKSRSLLMGGFVQKLDYSSDNFVKLIDSLGNEVWSRTYGEAGKDDLLQSLVKVDGNVVVVGGGRYSGQGVPLASSWGKGWIFGIDKLGLLNWEWLSPINEEVGVFGLHQTPDKGWIYVTATHQIISPDETANHIKVVRRDSSFNLVWERIISPLGPSINRIGGFAPTPDGNWVVSGTWAYRTGPGIDDLIFYNCLYKLNNQGDTLWGVRLKAPLGYEGVSSPGGFTVLPSGSVVWALRYDRYEPSPAQSFGWLIKVDNDGCVDTLCQMSSLIPEPVNWALEEERLRVFPNPASTQVTFDIPNSETQALLKVLDASGKVLWVQQFRGRAVWNAETNPSGLYFYTLTSEGRPVATGKISLMK